MVRAAIAALGLALSAPALAQPMDHSMRGMTGTDHTAPENAAAAPDRAAAAPADTPGDAAPPPVPGDHPADRFFDPARMAVARAALLAEGRWRGHAVILDRLEYRAGSGADGYAWRASGWYGSDLDKVVLAGEGEGAFGRRAERTELRAVWRHAVSPWFNVEAGVRHDFSPRPQRSYAVIGLEGLAPYWIETELQAFVSERGDAHLRLAASHDLRLSGPLVLQPAAELNAALQDVSALGISAGLERIELGARLRYELRPDFAPYAGVNWERDLGGTARSTRVGGSRASGVTGVVGLRAFF